MNSPAITISVVTIINNMLCGVSCLFINRKNSSNIITSPKTNTAMDKKYSLSVKIIGFPGEEIGGF
ncbi:hypothetical protein ACLFKQ_28065 [Myxosarcina sp. GI1(2024)]